VPADSSRLTRRLRSRDRRFLAVFACLLVAAIPVGVVISHESADSTPSHCIAEQGVGFMGGGATHFCGAKADAECRRAAATSTSLAAQCRRIGD